MASTQHSDAISLPSSPTFPPELISLILSTLPVTDQRSACLISRSTRKLAIKYAFEEITYSGYDICERLIKWAEIRQDIRDCVKRFTFVSAAFEEPPADSPSRLFIFTLLPTLPSIQALTFKQDLGQIVLPGEVSRFFDAIRPIAQLSELYLDFGFYGPVEGQLPVGPAGLKKLEITWKFDDADTNKVFLAGNTSVEFAVGDKAEEAGSRLAHLYSIITPSLSTLVHLKIVNAPEHERPDLDLTSLKGAGQTLRSFEYALQSLDEEILDTIPDLFPFLEKLNIKWSNFPADRNHSVIWKENHIKALSKNVNLVSLKLSCDFEVDANDTVRADDDIAWFLRCYVRRLDCTRLLVSVLPKLESCTWLQLRVGRSMSSSMEHPFVVEERLKESGKEKVVRGLKQFWMGRNQEDWVGDSSIVKCKIEDLPGDVIGENEEDAEEDDYGM